MTWTPSILAHKYSGTDRFWPRVQMTATTDDCWPWTGASRKAPTNPTPYGALNGTPFGPMAHRVAYGLAVGPIPDGLTIDHLCRNTLCQNPWHLEPVPLRTNILRGNNRAAQAARMTVCPHGHPLVGHNVYIRPSDGKRRCRRCNNVSRPGRYKRKTA